MPYFQLPHQGYEQVSDASNPAAQAYARQALARNGIHVPPHADAAALWRQFSQQRMLQQNEASMGPLGDPFDAQAPGASAPPQPGIYDPGDTSGTPVPGPEQIGSRLPEGGGPLDWRSRISQMAHHLSPGNTVQRTLMGQQFQHTPGGAAEQAFLKLQHVHDVHTAARNMASIMSHRKPSRTFRAY